MRKLIETISRKFLHQRKSLAENELKTQKKLLSFMFRKQKLKQTVTLKSFSKYQDYAGKTLLATSNFEGTQFIIKPSANEFSSIKQDSQLEENNTQPKNERSIQNLFQEPHIPHQVNDRFRKVIQQINHIVREFYFHKKKLMEEPPFEWNISLTLWLLIVFVAGLVMFELNSAVNVEYHQSQTEAKRYSYGFCAFLAAVGNFLLKSSVLIGFANLTYVLYKPYKPFNFDYHVIENVSKKLMDQNNQFFNQKNFILVCNIEMTWILLKPKDNMALEPQEQ